MHDDGGPARTLLASTRCLNVCWREFRIHKGRPANGGGVLKFRTFPDGGGGWFVKVRTSENF